MHRILRRPPGLPVPWPDLVLALVLAAIAVWLVVQGDNGSGSVLDVPAPDRFRPPPPPPFDDEPGWPSVARDVTVTLLMTLPLAGRRRWPLICFAIQFGALMPVDIHVSPAHFAALVTGAYSLAVYGRSAAVSMGVLLATAGATAAVKSNTWPPLPDWAGVFAILVPIGLFGIAIRAARSRAHAADQRAEAVKREQEAATRLAVAQERARIARELHDVVSHHVSVMTIQAGAAGQVLDANPELARGALTAIADSGRETMTELRHLLGVLAPGPFTPGSADDLLHPQPGLDQLDALVDNVRQAGQPVSVQRVPVALPRGVDLTAYRVVQEALTNALRYAPGARTDISITRDSTDNDTGDLLIEVTNEAAPPDARPADGAGTGSGLLGLAERLRVYGGTLETDRRLGGGFRMRARLPLEASP